MNHSMNARRIAVWLLAPALLFTAACGSESGEAAVSGKFGAEPQISIPEGDAAGEVVVKTLIEGDGKAVRKGEYVRLGVAGKNWKDGRALPGTWNQQPRGEAKADYQAIELLGQQSASLPKGVLDKAVGTKAGSRVLVQGSVGELIGDSVNPESGLTAEDTLVYVIDVAASAKADRKGEVKGEQAPPAEGMPTVEAESGKAADITIPKGVKAPRELKQQVLIKGGGPEVKAGQGMIVQYTGVAWEDGKKFDSSWDHGGATAFQIGSGMVIPGWDQALVGKHVGDRVLVVVPPELGYGGQAGNPLQKKTLVFSVDVLGVV